MFDRSQFSILSTLERQHELHWSDADRGECFCPGHHDGEKKGKKSLHVEIKPNPKSDNGESMLVLYCHAGCETKAIVEAMGLTMAALYPQRGSKPAWKSSGKMGEAARGTWDCAYDYRDASGKLVHQTIRYKNPKSFAQRRPAPSSESFRANRREYKAWRDRNGQLWYWTLQGIEPVVYNLPQILKADPQKLILLCEGEKDADAAGRLGMLATTVPMGTGKWRASYTEVFRGRRVLIIPDMDRPRMGQTNPMANPGVDGARKIAVKLVGIAAEVRIVYLDNRNGQLVPKYDLSDWIAAGGDLRQLAELAAKADLLTPGHPGLTPAGKTAADLDADAAPEIDLDTYLFPPELTSGESAATAPALPAMLPAVITPAAAPTAPSPDGQSAGQSTGTELIRRTVSNYILTADGPEALSMRTILNTIQQATGGWPKRVGGALFYCDQESDPDAESYRIDWLDRTEALFGWLGNKLNAPLDFARVPMSHTKGEVFAEFQRSAESIDGIQLAPHEPLVRGQYYTFAPLPPSDGTHLRWLLNRFSVATARDRDLLKAALMTTVWGGPGGSRPLFVLTAKGTGSGKTTFAKIAAELVGGSIDITPRDDISKIKERLLSPQGREKRLVLIDNLKSQRFSWAELEALITATDVSGREMYKGEGQRPNLLTYLVTVNGPSLSEDVAMRSVIIKFVRPKYHATWESETFEFIRHNRLHILADLVAALREPVTEIDRTTRWGTWEHDVLRRLPEPSDLQRLVEDRRQEANADGDEAQEIEAYFREKIVSLEYNPDRHRIAIPSRICCDWLGKLLREKLTVPKATARMKKLIDLGAIKRLRYLKTTVSTNGRSKDLRGFEWYGAECPQGEQLFSDIERRLSESRPSELSVDTEFSFAASVGD